MTPGVFTVPIDLDLLVGRGVYVLRTPAALLMKIGRAGNIARRVRSIELSSPVPVFCVAMRNGGAEEERRIHRLLAPYRDHGEWFRAEPDALQRLASLGKWRAWVNRPVPGTPAAADGRRVIAMAEAWRS